MADFSTIERSFVEAVSTLPARLLRTESLAYIASTIVAGYAVFSGHATPEQAVAAVGACVSAGALILGRSHAKAAADTNVNAVVEAGANAMQQLEVSRPDLFQKTGTGEILTDVAKVASIAKQVIEAEKAASTPVAPVVVDQTSAA